MLKRSIAQNEHDGIRTNADNELRYRIYFRNFNPQNPSGRWAEVEMYGCIVIYSDTIRIRAYGGLCKIISREGPPLMYLCVVGQILRILFTDSERMISYTTC